MHILVTGGAGFIGGHLSRALVTAGHSVVVVDNLLESDQQLRDARLSALPSEVEMIKIDITDEVELGTVFKNHAFDAVYHLAGKVGVRDSVDHPHSYVQANYVGTLNVFELAKHHKVPHVIFASSSSVYGASSKESFAEGDPVDEPLSVYASTKRAGELLAYTYCHLFGMNITCLRFFTVYGPFGRSDMAPFIFTKKIIEGETVEVFNHGNQRRDFTYVSDIVAGCVGVLDKPQGYNPLNLGQGTSTALGDFIATIESIVGVTAKKEYRDAQPGDVPHTHADIQKANTLFGYQPSVGVEEGMKKFISWYKDFYKKT